ncbi:MAG: glycosyltransferase family 2 protein [Desertifilum sp. SIO1I2]|nr:glycosyltransferase family 2 protein [Desertifilum sp. SIO1I2]
MTLVTIIIPTYNYAQYIGEAINSVLQGDYLSQDLEIIVVDDGSTDNTRACLENYQNFIQYIYQDNLGKAAATQKGIELAKGKYIFNLDADDLFLPQKINKVVEIFEQDSSLTHVSHPALYWKVSTDTREIEAIPDCIKQRKIKGEELINYFYPRRMLFGGGSTFAAKTEFLKRSTIPSEVDMFTDEYLVLVALNKGYTYFLNEPLSVWRIHGKNFSEVGVQAELLKRKNERSLKSMYAVLKAVKDNDFSPPLPEIYELKVQSSKIALQQDSGELDIQEIRLLWKIFFKNFPAYRKEALTIFQNYTLLNRTLPPQILQFLKQVKRNSTRAVSN